MNVENGTPWKSTSVAVALPIRVMRTGVVGKMAEVRAIGGYGTTYGGLPI